MCPAAPRFIRSVPQRSAQCRTVLNSIQGSLELATTITGNGNGFVGRNSEMPKCSGSAGATSKAPAMRSAWSLPACTAARTPNEWAAIKTRPVAREISRRTRLDQSGRCGSFQSRCEIRMLPVRRCSSQVCQCVGPLDRSPGTISVVDMEIILECPSRKVGSHCTELGIGDGAAKTFADGTSRLTTILAGGHSCRHCRGFRDVEQSNRLLRAPPLLKPR